MLATLTSRQPGDKVAGVAVVRWVGERKDVRTWTGAVLPRREAEIVDASLRPTTICVWGHADATALGKIRAPRMVRYEGRVSAWRGRSLNGPVVLCRADIPQTDRGDAAATTWIFRGQVRGPAGDGRGSRFGHGNTWELAL